jgi:hypothetical protein
VTGKEKANHDREAFYPEVSRNILAEWREDYRLAKLRDETGIEPASGLIKQEPASKPAAEKSRPRRGKEKGIDIPF